MLKNVTEEILKTEKEYVKDLTFIVEVLSSLKHELQCQI